MNKYIKATKPATPDADWIRPTNWAEQPIPESQEVSMLYYLGGDYHTTHHISFNVQGDCEIWIDDTLFEPLVNSGVDYIATFNADDYGFFHKGEKWAWVKVRPKAGQNLEKINYSIVNLPGNTAYVQFEVYEIIINMPNCNPVQPFVGPTLAATQLQLQRVRHIQFNDIGVITNGGYMFQTTFFLEHITNLDMVTEHMTYANRMFQRSVLLSPRVLNFPNLIMAEAFVIYNGAFGQDKYLKINVGPNFVRMNQGFYQASVLRGVEFNDCSYMTNATQLFVNCPLLQRAIVPGIKTNFDIRNCPRMTEQALLDTVDSMADLTSLPTQTLTLILTPQYPSVDAALALKNWTVVY